jgi:hypothetical protein
MSGEKNEEIIKRGLTAKSIIIGIIISIVWSVYGSLMSNYASGIYANANLGVLSANPSVLGVFGGLLLSTIILSALSPALKLRNQELACIFTFMLVAGGLTLIFDSDNISANITAAAVAFPKPGTTEWKSPRAVEIAKAASPLLWPLYSEENYKGIWEANAPIPPAYYTSIIFHIVYFGSACLFFIFAAALMGRQLVRVEALSFPLGQAELTLLKAIPQRAVFKMKWFWIGAVISFICYGWTAISRGMMAPGIQIIPYMKYDLTPISPLPYVPLMLDWQPVKIAFGYLMPLDILLSAVISLIFCLFILNPLLAQTVYMPYLTPWKPGIDAIYASHPLYKGMPYGVIPTPADPPNYPIPIFYMGIFIGMFLWTLWISKFWKRMSEWKKTAEGTMSTMVLLTGAVISFIIWLVCYIISGAPVDAAIFMVGFLALYSLGAARWRSDSGGFLGGLADCGTGGSMAQFGMLYGWFLIPEGYVIPEPGKGVVPGAEHVVMGAGPFTTCFFGRQNWHVTNPIGYTLEAYFLGNATESRFKDITISALISCGITVILMTFLTVYWLYLFDGTEMWRVVAGGNFHTMTESGWTGFNKHAYGAAEWAVCISTHVVWYNGIPLLFAGIATALVLYYLRGRYRRFFFHPAGLLYGLMVRGWAPPEFFLPLILAYIIKYLTIRVLGAETYMRKGVPVATGIMAGMGILYFVSSGLMLLRAFHVIRGWTPLG